MASAIFWARALRGWPYRPDEVGQPLLQGLERWPMGIWWLESLADAPAYWSDQLGHWALAEDDPYLALLAWEQAERIRPDLYAWWFPRARALAALERYDEADALLQGATERKPKSSAIWATWGDLLRDQGRYDEARQRYINGWRSQATRVDLLARAIRMAGRQDAREGLDFVRRLELSGQLPRTLVVDIACARLFHEAGELTNCRDRLAPHVDDDDEAQLLWDQCAILDPMEGL
jgi:tetratricopeptide (TPR) repeat protein